MRLPNWFKITWWLLLSGTVTTYLFARYPELAVGRAVPADVIVFLVWIALLLTPIFHEFEFFGMKFRQEIQKVKEEFKTDIQSIRADIRNAIDVHTTFSPQITIPAPPPDAMLPNLETHVKAAVAEALAVRGVLQSPPIPTDLSVTDDISFLFTVRYGIERELRRLTRERQLEVRRVGIAQLSRALVQAGVIEPPFDHAIREVYAISSAGVHAEDVTHAQVEFVRDVGPQLIGALRAIRSGAS